MNRILNHVTMLIIICMAFTANAQIKFDPAELTTNGNYQIEGNWSQLKRGWNLLVIKVSTPTQQPLVGINLGVIYDMVGMPMSPPDKPVVDKRDGTYEKQVFIGMKGDWKFDLKLTDAAKFDLFTRQQRVQQ